MSGFQVRSIADVLYRIEDCACGSNRIRYHENDSYTKGRLVCLDCDRKTKLYKDAGDAVEEWNR